MIISIIAALDKNRVIGNGKKIPWHLPADFAYFKKTTMGHPVIMGNNTFQSIGKPLPGRKNIVLTRQSLEIEGAEVAHSFEEAIKSLEGEEEIFVIGGAYVYSEALPLADRLYLTFIEGEFVGDIFFPLINWNEWKEIKSEERKRDNANPYNMKFTVFERSISKN